LDEKPVPRRESLQDLREQFVLLLVEHGTRGVRVVRRGVLNGTGRGSLLPSQEINSLTGGDNPEPTGQAAAPVSFELPEFFEVIPDKGEK